MSLGSFLLSMSGWYGLLIFIMVFMTMAACIALIAARAPVQTNDDAMAGPNELIANAVATANALLLAFVIVVVWEKYTNVRDTAAAEASALMNLARDAASTPEPTRRNLFRLLENYAQQVSAEDWPALARARHDEIKNEPRTAMTLSALWHAVARLDKTSNSASESMLSDLKEVSANRSHRFALARDGVTDPLWTILIVSAVATLVLTIFRFRRQAKRHLPIFLLYAAVLGALLWLVVDSDNPFGGSQRVQPDVFEHALNLIRVERQTAESVAQ